MICSAFVHRPDSRAAKIITFARGPLQTDWREERGHAACIGTQAFLGILHQNWVQKARGARLTVEVKNCQGSLLLDCRTYVNKTVGPEVTNNSTIGMTCKG